MSLTARIDPGWADALAPVASEIAQLEAFLAAEVESGRGFLPAEEDVFRAFEAPFR